MFSVIYSLADETEDGVPITRVIPPHPRGPGTRRSSFGMRPTMGTCTSMPALANYIVLRATISAHRAYAPNHPFALGLYGETGGARRKLASPARASPPATNGCLT
jgi:hypothetical protein